MSILNPEKPWHSLAYGIFVQHDQFVRMTKREDTRRDSGTALDEHMPADQLKA